MKIVTFNLRCDNPGDGPLRFLARRGLVIDHLETQKPDLVGFQEVTPSMMDYLREKLRGYALVGCGREKDYQGEHNPIAFRSDRYELIGLDVSWLSPTPNVPGSRYPDQSPCPRIVTHAVLRPLTEGAPFHLYNTHLDHVSSDARVRGAERLLAVMKEDLAAFPYPLLLTGDFNANPGAPEMRLLAEDALGLTDLTQGVGTTWHDWGRVSGERIDYIFARGFQMEGAPEVWSQRPCNAFLSDHYPVAATIFRKDGGAC